MCGISVYVNKSDSPEQLGVKVDNMNKQIRHRGPDNEGVAIQSPVALGHQRLSIIDMSADANQPFDQGDDYTMVFNGEIYNYIEIREELIQKGYQFRTKSDTEVLVNAYAEFGKDCVNRFNGMWSFVIYDKKQNLLFCSRDRFGIKPFYYSLQNESFYAASELKQIATVTESKTANASEVLKYLLVDVIGDERTTFFNGIYSLKPGHNLTLDLKTLSYQEEQYYDLGERVSSFKGSYEESKVELDKIFKSAVDLRLRSDVKVGTCLSGGLDSSILASVASMAYREQSGSPFMAFTAQSNQKESDETEYAREVVEKHQLDWKLDAIKTDGFSDLLEKVVYNQDEPFRSPSIFMQNGIMRQAGLNSCKVLLDGQGGDETFLGYERYYIPYLFDKGLLSFPGRLIKAAKNSKHSIARLMAYSLYFSLSGVRKTKLRKKGSFLKQSWISSFDWNIIDEMNSLNVRDLQVNEIKRFNLPALLRYSDRNAMMYSIESRLPYLDYRVVEYALGLKVESKINKGWTKYILRDTFAKVLPRSIAWRKNKIGFESPTETWLKDRKVFKDYISKSKLLKELVRDMKEIDNVNTDMYWRLLNLAVWEKVFAIEKIK